MGFSNLIASNLRRINKSIPFSRSFSNKLFKKPPWRVLFFGTDEFSIYSLEALTQEYRTGTLINKLEVVTTIKAAKANAVKAFADEKKLNLHNWPFSFEHDEFDVGLVVSFGHLIPKDVIEKFEFGMLNVHASLLPRWRGAAPIIYAIANGDTQTGITIMKISPEKFDIGQIVLQEKVPIGQDIKMRELHTILAEIGAKNLIKTLQSLPEHIENAVSQPTEGVTYAPKIRPSFVKINWNKMTSEEVFNLARAMDGVFYPQTSWHGISVKLICIDRVQSNWKDDKKFQPGYVMFNKEEEALRVLCSDRRFIKIRKIGVMGKKIMTSTDFNNGYIKKEPPALRYFK